MPSGDCFQVLIPRVDGFPWWLLLDERRGKSQRGRDACARPGAPRKLEHRKQRGFHRGGPGASGSSPLERHSQDRATTILICFNTTIYAGIGCGAIVLSSRQHMARVPSEQRRTHSSPSIARYPAGVGAAALQQELRISRRTVERHVAGLIREGKVRREGAARAAKYLAVSETAPPARKSGAAEEEAYVPFFQEARAIRDLIRKPTVERRPAGYRAKIGVCWRSSF